MSVAIPIILSGNAPALIDVGPHRQMLVENLDPTDGTGNNILVGWNDSVGAWLLKPGTRLGIALTGTVLTVTLTPVAATPAYQILLQG